MMLTTDWLLWVIIAASGLLTFGLRSCFVFLFGRLGDLSPRLQRILGYVPAAVLSALVVPILVVNDDQLLLAPGNTQLLAGMAAALAAWLTENMLVTIVVGMVCFWVFRFLL